LAFRKVKQLVDGVIADLCMRHYADRYRNQIDRYQAARLGFGFDVVLDIKPPCYAAIS
jgi:hypothetical protein